MCFSSGLPATKCSLAGHLWPAKHKVAERCFKITAQSYLTKNKIIENAAIMWNKLENNIKAIQSRTVFKENFKKYLLSTY